MRNAPTRRRRSAVLCADHLPATMRAILSKSLTLRGFINYDFASEYYHAFLREVGTGIANGRIRYREDFVDGLEKAPEAFIGMLEGRNFGKLIVRVNEHLTHESDNQEKT